MTRRNPQTRTLKLELDDHTVTLAAEALRGEADRRRRVGLQLSSELVDAKRGGADIRSGALQVVTVLAEADSLAAAAEQLAGAWDAGVAPKTRRRSSTADATPEPSPVATPDASPGDDDDDPDDEDDLDDLAGLDDADLEAIRQLGDGSTALEHDLDPDVAAARALLVPPEPPAAVAPAGAPTIPPAP